MDFDVNGIIAAMFQFHKVRLKEMSRGANITPQTTFQFHKVRLKEPHRSLQDRRYYLVSIP